MKIQLTFIHPIHTLHECWKTGTVRAAGIKIIHFTDEINNGQEN